jgi:hypothetical protein
MDPTNTDVMQKMTEDWDDIRPLLWLGLAACAVVGGHVAASSADIADKLVEKFEKRFLPKVKVKKKEKK